MPMRSDRTIAALVAVVAIAGVFPALGTGFNADDYLILWRIKSIQAAGDPLGYFKFAFYEYFRPLGFLSFALDWRLWHLDAFGFHLTNVVLHALNSMLVFALARRMFSVTHAAIAGLLFALHPASHEAVYWIAARFDLLATFWALLALLALSKAGKAWRAAGAVAFALALLSKESAIALVIIAPAWDVFIARRNWRGTAIRLAPLVIVVALYTAARMMGADLDATGGGRRLPKALMALAGVVAALLIAWRRDHAGEMSRPLRTGVVTVGWVAGFAGFLWVLGSNSAGAWFIDRVAFVRHVFFFATSPVVFPAPAAGSFLPESLTVALFHVAWLAAIGHLLWRAARRGSNRDDLAFAVVFTLAALLPVSSMTGGLRYLYLPTAGVVLLAAGALSRLSGRAHVAALAAIVLILAVSTQQILQAGRAWRTASAVTREGVQLMASAITRCGQDEVLLLATPVAIGGVYANLSWDAFDVLAGCTPKSFMTLLRVVGSDLRATVSSPSPAIVEIRAEHYEGNIVASEDLRNFIHYVDRGANLTIETAAGRLQTFPDGTTQVFRLEMNPDAQAAKRFYYSDGRIRR